MYRFLPALALLSGVSGIAYELLYFRLLTSYIGSVFYVASAMLTVFFVGMAVGAYRSSHQTARLQYIELGIGLYAVLVFFIVQWLGLTITQLAAALPFTESINLLLFTMLTLILPAFLIGFTTPLFTKYIQFYCLKKEGFTLTYILYNIGAALAVLVVEYLLIRSLGISTSLLVFAGVNFCIAGLLSWIDSPLEAQRTVLEPVDRKCRVDYAVLGILSVASGVVQLAIIATLERTIGPLQENFALILSVMLLSVAVGTAVVSCFRLTLTRLLTLLPIVLALTTVLYASYVQVFALGYESVPLSLAVVVLLKFLLVALVILPVMSLFGATVPALVAQNQKISLEKCLAIAALGNALGFLLFTYGLFSWVAIPVVCLVAVGVVYIVAIWYNKRHGFQEVFLGGLLVLISILTVHAWPTYLGNVAYHELPEYVAAGVNHNAVRTVTEYRQFGNDVTIVSEGNETTLLFNGYRSLRFNQYSRTPLLEATVGEVGAWLTAEHESALVFGLGTGVTAAAVAGHYDQVTVAEINPVMQEAARYFEPLNDRLLQKSHVDLVIQDALVTLLTSNDTYDLIVNTVTTPAYFSANKLWTKDVFQAVSDRLEPEGVFVGWIDNRLGLEGLQIMFATLDDVFAECWYVYLDDGYYAFACGNDTLVFRSQLDAPGGYFEALLHRYFAVMPPEEFLYTLLFKFDMSLMSDQPLNTIDRPRLETLYVLDRAVSGATLRNLFLPFVTQGLSENKAKDEDILQAWRGY